MGRGFVYEDTGIEVTGIEVKKRKRKPSLTDSQILDAVVRAHGNVSAAARNLGIPLSTVVKRLAALPISNLPEVVLWHRLRCHPSRLDIRDYLFKRYAPLVRRIAAHIKARLPPHADFDTLVAAGLVRLHEAISRYDHTRPVKFTTFATFHIRGGILDELRRLDHVPRKMRECESRRLDTEHTLTVKLGRPPTPEETQAELNWTPSQFAASRPPEIEDLHWSHDDTIRAEDEIRPDEPAVQPVEPFSRDITVTAFARATRGLPFEHRIVLHLHYVRRRTFRQIGEALDLCESRCSQMHNKALDWMREHKSKEELIEVLM